MNDFRLPSRIEKQYAFSIQRLLQEAFFAASLSGRDFFEYLKEQAESAVFKNAAENLAKRFVFSLLKHNIAAWKSKGRSARQGREIFLALQEELSGHIGQLVSAQVQRNAFYITNLPLEVSKQLTKKIAQQQQAGMRAENMAREILKIAPNLSRHRVNLIARTEASKASTALTRARSYDLGLDWYVWRTSEDGRVRSSHSHMQNVLVKWTDPPSPESLIGEKNIGRYHAGEVFNCRCFCEPVVDLSYLQWPRKVYTEGRIVKMTKTAFESRI